MAYAAVLVSCHSTGISRACISPSVLSTATGLPDASNYREICVALRQEHDREVAISQQLQVWQGSSTQKVTNCITVWLLLYNKGSGCH